MRQLIALLMICVCACGDADPLTRMHERTDCGAGADAGVVVLDAGHVDVGSADVLELKDSPCWTENDGRLCCEFLDQLHVKCCHKCANFQCTATCEVRRGD